MKRIETVITYNPSEAFQRSQWTGETVEQAQAAIDADRIRTVQAFNDLAPMIASRLAQWADVKET